MSIPTWSTSSTVMAALIAAVVFSAPPAHAAPNAVQLAMHDMMPMQPQTPGMQQGPMSGMQGGGHDRMQQPGMAPGMGMGSGMAPGMGMGSGVVDLTDRLEGRLAFLRTELHITDAQTSAWNGFADALRAGRKHLIEARHALMQTTPSARLEQYERHLTERLQALTGARVAFQNLYGLLDESQKRTAEELVIPYIATF